MLERAKNRNDCLPQQTEVTENECEKMSEDGERKRGGSTSQRAGLVTLGEMRKCVAAQRNRNEREKE